MKRMIAMFALLACGAASPAARTNVCDVYGWGSTPRTQVRSAPAQGARFLGVLRHRAAVESDQEINGTFPEFRIIGAQGGWFRITGTDYGDYGDPLPRWRWFRGTGWVHGDQIGGQVMAGRLHIAPSERSRSRDYGKPADIVEIRRLLDCQGHWVKVEADIGTGWIDGLCNNQVTNCS